MGDDATTQPRGRLKRQRAYRRLIQMRLHLGNDRGTLVGLDDQSMIDWRQCRAFEGNVQYRPAHCGHPALYCLHLSHIVSSEPGYLSSSRKGYCR